MGKHDYQFILFLSFENKDYVLFILFLSHANHLNLCLFSLALGKVSLRVPAERQVGERERERDKERERTSGRDRQRVILGERERERERELE